jgi:glucose uptake protein
MILPQTYAAAVFVLVLALLCQGSWANTFKLTRKYRFELFYFDFAFGLIAAAVIAAYTLGSMGFDGFSLMDDLLNAGKRQWLFGFGAGIVFNLGNMLLLGSVSVAGLMVAFPVGIGLAMIISSSLRYVSRPEGSPVMLFSGCALVLAAILVDALGNRQLMVLRHEQLARAGKTKSTRRPSSAKGVVLALAAGVLIGSCSQLLDKGRDGDLGMGPYSLGLMFGAGAFFSTFLLSMFFMNLPVEGEAVDITDYFKAKLGQHFLGFIGGFLWMAGAVASFVALTPHPVAAAEPSLTALCLNAVPLLAAIWGVAVWKELRGSDARARSFMLLMLVLLACGVVLMSMAAAPAAKAL